MGDGRVRPDAPFQQVPRAKRSAAEAEGEGVRQFAKSGWWTWVTEGH